MMRLQMKTRMKKSDLIAKIEAGLEEHKKQYERALQGWMAQMNEAAQKVVQRVKEGTLRAFPKEFRDLMQIPSLNVADYEAALAMLKANVDDEVVLEPEDFDQLVLGNWEWKERWVTSNSRYMGG